MKHEINLLDHKNKNYIKQQPSSSSVSFNNKKKLIMNNFHTLPNNILIIFFFPRAKSANKIEKPSSIVFNLGRNFDIHPIIFMHAYAWGYKLLHIKTKSKKLYTCTNKFLITQFLQFLATS